HQESNPGPTDYKEGAFNLYISGLQIFLLRGNVLKATACVRSMEFITWGKEADVAQFILRQLSAKLPLIACSFRSETNL
ncbi:hypothetical protein A221_03739, partial [Pseudomonas syringae pv. actinidiae ICMP 18801]